MFLLQLMIAIAIAAPTEASLTRFLSSGINKVDGVQNTEAPKLSPSVVVIIVLLAVVFFFSGLLHIVARCLVRYSQTRHNSSANANANANASILHGQLQHLFSLHDSGVEQAFIDALPVFFYKSVQGLKDAADCAVCLSEFHGDDRLRLLPNCSHAFHIDCIDTWLLSHSTCPLCRRSLLPDPIATQSLQVDADRDETLPDIRSSNISDQALAMDPAAGEEGSDSAELQSIQPTSQKGSTLVSVQLGRFCPMAAAAAAAGMENVMGTNSSSGRRSYSMGSYEYVIDPSNLQVVVAPTPVHRRWANWKLPPTPGHKSALSDFTPHCSVEDPSPAFSEELSVASSCFCPRDASAYSKHKTRSRPPSQETTKTANTVDGDGGQMKRAVSFGVNNADVKLMQSPVCEANSIEVVDVECSPRVSIQNGGGVGSRRYLIARKTLHWLMGRERRFVYPAVNP